jgi:hypothetical protein
MKTIKYLLPCTCGEKVQIDVKQAGENVVCVCGNSLSVPKLRDIRALDSIEVAEPRAGRGKESDWGTQRGLVFSSGILVAVLAFLCGGGLLVVRSRIDTSVTPEQMDSAADAQIDAYTPEMVLQAWQVLRDQDIGPKVVPAHIAARRFSSRLMLAAGIAGAIGLIGLAASAAASLTKPGAGRSS